MKCLVLSTSFPESECDFTGIFILQLVQVLTQKGCEITVITPGNVKLRNWSPPFCKVIRFRYAPESFQLLAQQPGGIPVALKNNPLSYVLIPSFLLSFLFHILKEARNCDVIQANWAICGWLAIILKPFHRKPIFVTLRGSDIPAVEEKKQQKKSILLRMVVCFSTAVVTVSESMAKNLSELMPIYKKKIFVIPNGVNSIFHKKEKKCDRKDKQSLKLIFIGSLVHRKGIDQLLRALNEVKTRDFFLNLVGTGPLEDQLKLLVKELNLTSKVNFIGSVPHQKIPQILQQADVLVLPSHHEGRPNVVLEAMFAGLPIIGTNIGGIQELVQNYKTGILFKDHDVCALAEAIIYFIDNPDKIEEMGQASREWIISQRLTWNNAAQAYVDLFSPTVQ